MFKYGKKKPQGATRNTGSRTSAPASRAAGLSSWLLVALGMGIGLFIAFMLYLWKPWHPVKREPSRPAESTTAPSPEKDTGEPRFDFYRLLPSQKVVSDEAAPVTAPSPAAAKPAITPADAAAARVTEQKRAEAILEGRNPPAGAAKPADKPKADGKAPSRAEPAAAPKPAVKEKAAEKPKEKEKEKDKPADTARFTLQAGSFKSQAEAERRKAKVAMQGLPARVQQVTVKEGQVWYRVVVGPFKGKDNSEKAQGSLRGEGIDSLLVKEKK